MEFTPKRTLNDDEIGEFYILVEKYNELRDQWESTQTMLDECRMWILRCVDFFGIHPDICIDPVLEDYHAQVKRYGILTRKLRILSANAGRLRSELIKLAQ